jgi:hypothetical protein
MLTVRRVWLGFFFVAVLLAGREVAERVWRGDREGAGPLELAATTGVFATAIAIALSWALALPRLLTRTGLGLEAAAVLACVVTSWWKRSRPAPSASDTPAPAAPRRERAGAPSPLAIAAAVALAAAVVFFLWRGEVVFSPCPDAAAYHLPKAAMLAQARGYETFDGPDVRVTGWPCDYEILLADVILLDGGDARTSWVSTAFFALFLLSIASIAERWWGRGRHAAIAVVLAGSMPIVLLHAGIHKNDLLIATLFLTSIAFGARWAAAGGGAPLVVALVSVAIALGTKGSAFFLVAALGPLAAWGCARRWRDATRPRATIALRWSLGGMLLFLALGGVVYLRNTLETGSPLGVYPGVQSAYGDWGNVARFTYLAFARPFSRSPDDIWVPWRHAYWHWGRYDLNFSEWGLPSSLLLFLLPLGVLRYARRAPDCSARFSERVAASLTVLIAFLLILPIHIVPLGFFAAFIRYTLFLPPLISLWTIVPAVAELDARGIAGRNAASAGIAASVVMFGWYMRNEIRRDRLEPLAYVLEVAKHSEDRRSHRTEWATRAGILVDRMAGPDDVIAVDGAFDCWSYYGYGADLRRRVAYLHSDRGVPVTIAPEVGWVIVDRVWTISFGAPGFRDFGDWDTQLMRGTPSPEDLLVFRQLKEDPHFRLVSRDDGTNQAVFQRVSR